MIEEGWRQVAAGVALITWSRLASWNIQRLELAPSTLEHFESAAGHKEVHPRYGRLICWINFGVGAEYLAKGAYMLRGYPPTCPTKPIRMPPSGENRENWSRRINKDDPSIRESELSYETLGRLPMEKILDPGPDQEFVSATYRLLASAIRNRDAHRYAENVRNFHFHLVKEWFIPAFNIVLASLDKGELRIRFSESRLAGQGDS